VKRVLFDENLPRLLRRKLPDFEIRTVQEEGWGSFRNGELLRRAEVTFRAFLTADRRMEYQQKLTSFQLGIVVIDTHSLQLNILERAVNDIRAALLRVEPGQIIHVTVP
jgi:hypothetical protein